MCHLLIDGVPQESRRTVWPTLRSDSLFAPTRLYVEILPYIHFFLQAPGNLFPFGARLDRTWA